MLFQRPLLAFTFACLVMATALPKMHAQTTYKDSNLIPSSAIAAVFVDAKTIFEDPALELLPRELITAYGKKEFGIDLCELRSAMVVVDNVPDPNTPPEFAVTIRFNSPQTLNDDILGRAQRSELRGKPLYSMGRDQPVMYLPNNKTIVLGMEPFIKKMLSAKGAKSGLIDLIAASVGERDHVNAFVDVGSMRGMLNENLPPKEQFPLPFQSFRSLPDEIESLSYRMSLTQTESTGLKINAVDEKSATKIMKTIEQGLSMGRGMLMGAAADEMDNQPELLKALEAYDERAGDKLVEIFKPKLNGKTLEYRAADSAQFVSVTTIGTLIGMLLPAVQQVREAARRTQSANNLRQIALASLNYESAFMRLPANIVSADGMPLLSWRVAILPYLDEQALYDEFHLDEPWDSPHNIKLLDRMPEVLRTPNVLSDTKTVCLGFQGEGTMFDPTNLRIGFGSIADGSSNTILCVEANEDAAIEWSKPQDLSFDKAAPGKDVGDLRPGGFNAALCDGSVQFFSSSIDSKSLANLILRADGNIVDPSR